jgi:hypothetical protein
MAPETDEFGVRAALAEPLCDEGHSPVNAMS